MYICVYIYMKMLAFIIALGENLLVALETVWDFLIYNDIRMSF